MQQEVGEVTDGPLALPVAAAGKGQSNLQKALTRQLETTLFQRLDVDIRALAPDDMRRCSWLNVDKFSTTWVSAWPDADAFLANAEFSEVTTFYFGLPSPACRPMVGQRVGTSRMVLDAYGNRLTTLPLPGDGWRTQHDAIKWKLSADMLDMHVRSSTEVYGLFAPLIPQIGRNRLDGEPRRKRQGLVPDFMVYERSQGMELPCFIELKTLHFGSSTYPLNLQSRCEAVARRAAGLHGEYCEKARSVDTSYCETLDGHVGPVLQKLLSYGHVRGVVFGAWAESSPDTERLLSQLARQGANAKWRQMGSNDPESAVGCLAWLLRRRWGLTALRECARLKLERLAYVGRGAAAADERRRASIAAHASRARFYNNARASFERRRR